MLLKKFRNTLFCKRLYYRLQILRGSFKSGEREYALLPGLIQPGITAIDIGANVGHYSVLLSKLIGEGGLLFAFEPSTPTFRSLQANLDFSGCEENVLALNLGVADKNSLAYLSTPFEANSGYKNFYRSQVSNNKAPNSDKVLTVGLDSFLPSDLRIDFIKIDVEGLEDEVIEGARETIKKYLPLLVIENLSTESALFFESNHYKLFNFDSHNTVLVNKRDSKALEFLESMQGLRPEF